MTEFVCAECGRESDNSSGFERCVCGGPLEYLSLIRRGSRISLDTGCLLIDFSDFLPPLRYDSSVSLGEGRTPLISCEGPELEGFKVLLKNETVNPTWSFKDRGTYLTLLDATERGFSRFGTVSTGNMAASVAAYGARTGLDTTVLVSADIPDEKIRPITVYGPRVARVKGDYSDLFYKSIGSASSWGVYFSNSDVSMRVEGSKTIAFEIFLQLGEKVPDYVIVPTSSGGNIRGIEKGFRELREARLTERTPTMIAVQASGCSPIHQAFQNGRESVERFHNPSTIAHAIENPLPPSGNSVLKMLRRNGGTTIAVDEEDIIQAQQRLALRGFFVQPASATSLAAIEKLKKLGSLNGSTVVSILTGSGLKYPSALDKHPAQVIDVSIDSLDSLFR